MESLIYDNFKYGNAVEVFIKGNMFPIEAKFIKCSRGGVLLKTESGKKMVLPVDMIAMIKMANVPQRHTPYMQDQTQPFAPENFQSEPSSSALPPIEEKSENEPLENKEDESPADNTLFKLPSEKPQLKILGSIELEESDKKRNRFKPSYQPSSQSNATLAEDFRETMIESQGVIKSVGPVYGYIKTPDGPDIYVNRGEFLYRQGDNEILEPGSPVVFSLGSNWKGLMAKCVHRPMTVGEQLDFIGDLADTDVRNARLLARQLVQLFPDSEEIEEALGEYPQL